MISMFDTFKIGVGPSSSHTVGPMKAGSMFTTALREQGLLYQTERFRIEVYGSLSLTGRGHGTDSAIIAGLAGQQPDTADTRELPLLVERIKSGKLLPVDSTLSLPFDYEQDFIWHKHNLPLHENGMRLEAWADGKCLYGENYYSVGGGFIVTEQELLDAQRPSENGQSEFGCDGPNCPESHSKVPYPYRFAADLQQHCENENLRLSTLMLRNECALRPESEVRAYAARIWQVMQDCIQAGLNSEGVLPGRLRLPRRAPRLRALLKGEALSNDPMRVFDWVNMVAFAVNEENAAGGRVVTAPTNGACGIVPAVLAYYNRHIEPADEDTVLRYMLVCSAIGSLYKMNASISGAEVGCQGETGVASSMAAAGLTEIQGGTVEQVLEAAEIAMEHHLGLTCDPVDGQVQVPCIERNAMSAIKAINASRMALMRRTKSAVSLDKVIATMYETGKDMNPKYRETAMGGLAIHVVPC
ncbi:MAG: L-serine ammonia-lyase [Neisseria sp.]|nr:L-serine ammonia-lyase [Neisseria sp.]